MEVSGRVATFWASVAGLLTVAYWMARVSDPFSSAEPYSSASAHMALLARSFVLPGIIQLRGVPLQNNLPLGLQPDRYVHWPPLYPILLSIAFRIFGESERVVHAFVIAVNIVYVTAFYLLVRRCFNRVVAMFSLFALLTIPVFIQYGRLAWTPNAALAAVNVGLYCFMRGTESTLNWKWIAPGAIAVASGVLFSWEAALLAPVLFGLTLWQAKGTKPRAAAVYTAASMCAVAMVLILLLYSSPGLPNDLLSAARYRMGHPYQPAEIPIHAWVSHLEYTPRYSLYGWFAHVIDFHGVLLGGTLGLLSVIGMIGWSWNRRQNMPDVFLVVGSLLGIAVLWAALFPNHVFIHEYQALIAAPLVSISLGAAMGAGVERLHGNFRWIAMTIVPLILIVPLVRNTRDGFRKLPPDGNLEFARDIENSTPASGVILSALGSMVPVYYSNRHMIRGVRDDETFRTVTRQTGTIFPDSDVYLAIPPDSLGDFPCASSNLPVVRRTPSVVLLRVVAGVCR